MQANKEYECAKSYQNMPSLNKDNMNTVLCPPKSFCHRSNKQNKFTIKPQKKFAVEIFTAQEESKSTKRRVSKQTIPFTSQLAFKKKKHSPALLNRKNSIEIKKMLKAQTTNSLHLRYLLIRAMRRLMCLAASIRLQSIESGRGSS